MSYEQFTKGYEMIVKLDEFFGDNTELFRKIKGFETYSVSTLGRVRNDTTGKFRILRANKQTGYLMVMLYKKCKFKGFYLHKLVANAFMSNPKGKAYVDHISGDKLDNSLKNLRFATPSENGMNKIIRSNNTSGVPGVSFIKTTGKWRARINLNQKEIRLGHYKSFEDAVKARKQAEIEYFGEFRKK